MKKKLLFGIVIVFVVGFSVVYLHNKNTSTAKSNGSALDSSKINNVANNSSSSEGNTSNSVNDNSVSSSNSGNTVTGNNTSSNNSTNNEQASSAQNSNNSSSSSNTSSGTNANNSISNNTSASGNNESKDYTSYFGNWRITKSIGTLPIYALSKEDIAGYSGKVISLSKDRFTDTNGSVQKPKYVESTVSDTQFFDENRIHLSSIGVGADSIKKVVVYNPEGKPYNEIYLKDSKTMIYMWDGVFFQVEK